MQQAAGRRARPHHVVHKADARGPGLARVVPTSVKVHRQPGGARAQRCRRLQRAASCQRGVLIQPAGRWTARQVAASTGWHACVVEGMVDQGGVTRVWHRHQTVDSLAVEQAVQGQARLEASVAPNPCGWKELLLTGSTGCHVRKVLCHAIRQIHVLTCRQAKPPSAQAHPGEGAQWFPDPPTTRAHPGKGAQSSSSPYAARCRSDSWPCSARADRYSREWKSSSWDRLAGAASSTAAPCRGWQQHVRRSHAWASSCCDPRARHCTAPAAPWSPAKAGRKGAVPPGCGWHAGRCHLESPLPASSIWAPPGQVTDAGTADG